MSALQAMDALKSVQIVLEDFCMQNSDIDAGLPPPLMPKVERQRLHDTVVEHIRRCCSSIRFRALHAPIIVMTNGVWTSRFRDRRRV